MKQTARTGSTDLVRGLIRRKNEQKSQRTPNPRPPIARQVDALRESLTSLKGGLKTIETQIRVIENTIKELESTL